MYQQIKPTEVFRERQIALLEEAEERHLARRLHAGHEPRAWSTETALLGFLAALVVAGLMLAASSSPAHAASIPIVVNSTLDWADLNTGDGVCDASASLEDTCTLRAAIQQANATLGADVIDFKIPKAFRDPSTGVATISPQSPLPTITDPVTMDGYSQPGSSPNTLAKGTNAVLKVELDGSNAGRALGLSVRSDNSVVKGLVVNNFDAQGLQLNGSNNKLEGNFVGTDPSGTKDQGNGFFGVEVDSGTDNTVGGTSPEARNLISGNDFIGVFLSVGSASSEVLGNYIGTNRGGTGDLGNSGAGVGIQGVDKNTIGDGTAAGANIIAFNDLEGVTMFNFSDPNDANANTISRNSIFSNAGLGIDLQGGVEDALGRTANDAGDIDQGPNGLQNKPVLSSAKTVSGLTTIKGKINSVGNVPYIIQFFSNPPGGDEGKKFIGKKIVATDASSGSATFTFKPKKKVAVGRTITATATRNFFSIPTDTSEFSAPKKVVAS